MDNNDIKIYKINFIKKEFGLKIDDEKFFNKSLQELNNIIDIEEFKFVDDTYEEYFELLGKNIKNYNILNDYYTNQKDIKKYIDERKKEIQNKIELFYECEKDDKNIIRLLYFSTLTKYNLEQFLSIANYVPFKYFIPEIKSDENNKKYFKNHIFNNYLFIIYIIILLLQEIAFK